MTCPPMDAVKNQGKAAAKKMGRAAGKKKPSHSWLAMGLYHHHHPSSGKSRGQPAMATAEGKKGDNENGRNNDSKKKRSISISKSMACAGSICSTKESSVMNRGSATARTASSRSLKVPEDVTAAAAISATSSFNSETTVATTVTSSYSPLSSALSSPLSSFGGSFRGVQIRKLSGCYECHSVFDPRSLSAATAFPCTDCDEVFIKADSLELHRATRHAGTVPQQRFLINISSCQIIMVTVSPKI